MGPAAARLGDLRTADPAATLRLLEALDAALDAVEPARLVREALIRREDSVVVDGEPLAALRVAVLAFGKAAVGMSRAADQALGSLISGGLVVTDEAGDVPGWAELIVAGHPIPDGESVRAAHAAIALIDRVAPGELLLALVSGGGSALLEAPSDGLNLDDVRDLNDRLIRSGAPIEVINGVRQAVSKVKAGRLAARCRGNVATLVVSDVGGDPAVVASGPTVAAPRTALDVSEVFERFSIRGPAAERARRSARTPAVAGRERSRAGPALILADGITAGRAAAGYLTDAGLEAELGEDPLSGPACEAVGRALAATPEGTVRVLAGETTVEVTGQGRGGRNQHAAVAAGVEIAGSAHRFLAVGTDGVDGPTDAAGGYVDGRTVTDPEVARRHLAGCDSYPYLERAGALLRIGKTGTNVADVWIVDKSG